jgi:hypothetical protein
VRDELHLKDLLHHEGMRGRLERYWTGKERPEDRSPIRRFTRREQFFSQLFRSYLEIMTARSRLEMSAEFLHGLQPRRATAQVVAYHIEKHLEETYILRERIVTFLRRIERQSRKRRHDDVAARVAELEKLIYQNFEGVVRTRGMHVHEGRFEDEEVRRLDWYDLLLSAPDPITVLEPLRRFQARLVLDKWRKSSGQNVRNVNEILHRLFGSLEPVVFDVLAPKASMAEAPER